MQSYNNTHTSTSKQSISYNEPVAVATAVCPTAPSVAFDALRPSASSKNRERLNEKQVMQLVKQGFTPSLARSLDRAKDAFALRIWIVDNSGSMREADGHRIVDDMMGNANSIRFVDCTRWEEIRSTVEYHMQLASLIKAPTRFRMLNPARDFETAGGLITELSIGMNGDLPFEADDKMAQLRRIQPEGSTPLTQHMREIREELIAMAPELRQTGQRVSIVIATDGLPTNETGQGGDFEKRRFVEALRLLEGLPVWLVIRLCTDEDDVVDFYNDLDHMLELSIDVLDDFTAEAKEIYEVNPWINYALPLHRIREFGTPERLFDLIDERAFTRSEVQSYCNILFSTSSMDGAPDAAADWKGFLVIVSKLSKSEGDRWNPVKRRRKQLISVKKLGGRRGFCS